LGKRDQKDSQLNAAAIKRKPDTTYEFCVFLSGLRAGDDDQSLAYKRPVPSEQDAMTPAQTTRTVIDRFNEAFNRHDADALAALLTDDTVFEDTSPAPDGRRIEGKDAVVEYWRTWFGRNPDAVFEAEDVIVSGDGPSFAGSIARCGRDSRGTCVAWMSSPSATGKWPQSLRT
jgi:ketosteroid isomerase-like protein